MTNYCEACDRPYAVTERLMAGLLDLETAQEYHETTEEHQQKLKEAQ